MDEFAIEAVAWAARTAVAGAVVLALGRAALLLVAPPAVRQRVAAWTLRAAVLVPALTLLPAWWVVTLPDAAATAAAALTPLPAAKVIVAGRPDWPGEVVEPPTELVVVSVAGPDAPADLSSGSEWAEAVPPAPDFAQEPPAAGAPRPVSSLEVADGVEVPAAGVPPPLPTWRDGVAALAVGYAAGAAYFLGVFALGHLALARLRRSSLPATMRVQSAASAVSGGRRPPRVLVSDSLPSPVCFGVLRPTVVLPTLLARKATAEQLTWVLAHEADHLRRGDPLTGWFAGVAKALFFFAPWYWGVRRELRLAQEYLADAAALAAGGHPADYAEFLVDLTADPAGGRRTSLAHGVRAGRSDLSRRITMVLTTTPARGSRRWATPAAAGLLAAAVLLSGMGLVRADDPPKDPPTPAEVKPADKLKDEAAKLRDAAAKLRDEMRADRDKMQADKEKLRDESRADPEKRRGTPPPASEGQRGDVRTRIYTEKDGTIQLRIDVTGVAELKKQIAEALKANRPEAVMDLVAKLEKMLTANAPQPRGSRAIESTVTREPPSAAPAGSAGGPLVPPAPPAPPSAFRSLAPPTPPAQPRANLFAPALPNEAITALEKVLEANKDPETRASLVRAIAMLRSQNQSGQGFGFGPAAGGLAQPAGPPPLAAPVGGPPGYPTAGAFNPPGGFGGPPGMPSPDAIGNRSTSISTYGIVVAPLSEALAEQLQLKGRGVLVTAVKADSPFAKAGVKKNDILIAINRVVTDSVMDSTRKLAALSPGGVVTLRVLSKGKEADIDVPVPQPTEPARPGAKKVRFESKSVRTTHDTFSIEAKLGSVEYKITGKLNAGKVTSFNATVTEDKEVITVGQSLLEGDKDIDFGVTVAKYAPELKALLDSVRGQ